MSSCKPLIFISDWDSAQCTPVNQIYHRGRFLRPRWQDLSAARRILTVSRYASDCSSHLSLCRWGMRSEHTATRSLTSTWTISTTCWFPFSTMQSLSKKEDRWSWNSSSTSWTEEFSKPGKFCDHRKMFLMLLSQSSSQEGSEDGVVKGNVSCPVSVTLKSRRYFTVAC